jgi:FAD/FMN-containing dehydrogenase
MAKLNAFVNKFGRNFVAGSSSTVSVGGYITGSRHGIFSGKYGLATDNILQVELVVPSEGTLIANECQNTDLFWVVRGYVVCQTLSVIKSLTGSYWEVVVCLESYQSLRSKPSRLITGLPGTELSAASLSLTNYRMELLRYTLVGLDISHRLAVQDT